MEAAQAALFSIVEDEAPPETHAATPTDIEVRVSARRKKTVTAYWEGDRIVVVFPQRVP
ncbi:MAG: hypothetical protein QOF21_1908, partial [Actinomycetota bacterium]